MRIKFSFAAIFLFSVVCTCVHAEDYIQAKGAIQLSSNISDGTHSIRDITDIANIEGFKVVIITDRDLMRWQYGLWPIRRVLKMTIENSSIFKYGIKKYFSDIKEAQAAHPDMVVMGGVESAPFYYWKEDLSKYRLAIKNWHKHMIVIGLEDPGAVRRLPVTGNAAGLALPFGSGDLGYLIFPMLAFAAGIYFLMTKRFSYRRFHSILINVGNTRARVFGTIMLIIGCALLIYGYPYREMKFDQFSGDLGIRPYQNFINYVNREGGVVFWAHPEASNVDRQGIVDIVTMEHPEALLQSHDYTGYSVFYNGYERVGKPGGIWDTVLNEYCEGVRRSPVWAIGGMGVDRTVDLAKDLRDLKTVFLLRSLDKKEVMESLRSGRMYVVMGDHSGSFVLDSFTVRDPAATVTKVMGEELVTSGSPVIEVRGSFAYGEDTPVKVRLIRDGIVIKNFEEKPPVSVSYQDESRPPRKKYYYRVEMESKGALLVTNPIFVRRE